MKKFSAPPMIIILDVLFGIVFLLVLEASPNIKIVLPQNIWLKDMIVLSENSDKEIKYYFDNETKIWKKINTLPSRERAYDSMIGDISCKSYPMCSKIKPRLNETKKIYIKGDLYDTVSGLISDSCLRFPKECVNVTYYIKEDGTVDKERLKKEHQVFRHILKDEKK